MSKYETNVSDAEIVTAFENTNFGNAARRDLLAKSVFKRLVNHHCGHTITMIMRELKLTTPADSVTNKGKEFVAHHFNQLLIAGG